MSEWLEINPAEFSKSEQVVIHGANVELFLSPYDLPEAVRGSYDGNEKKFSMEFRYIGGDEPLDTDVRGTTTISVGRRSKRLYKIELAVDLTKGKSVGLRLMLPTIDEVLDKLAQDFPDARRSGNYKVAKTILEKRGDKILENQVAA